MNYVITLTDDNTAQKAPTHIEAQNLGIGPLLTDDVFEAGDFEATGRRIVVFNDNPGRGRHYLGLMVFNDENGAMAGHRFEVMEFHGWSLDCDYFEVMEGAIGSIPRQHHKDAARMAATFMADVYPLLMAGTIAFADAEALTNAIA